MILITTSRKPCNRTRSFCKDLQRSLPGSVYKTRGKSSLKPLLQVEKAVYITDWKGNPGKFEIYENGRRILSILIKGVKLRRERRKMVQGRVGELSKTISDALGLQEGIISEYDGSIVFKDGPEMRVGRMVR
jgi:U3 small nucleolar ribonucleoprotein protein IMP4